MAEIYESWLKYFTYGISMALMCGGRLKYLRNAFTMLEMT